MFAELFSLATVVAFLKDVLAAFATDKAKKWTKSQHPSTTGKIAAFELYQALERVGFFTQAYVDSLKAFVNAALIQHNPDRPN